MGNERQDDSTQWSVWKWSRLVNLQSERQVALLYIPYHYYKKWPSAWVSFLKPTHGIVDVLLWLMYQGWNFLLQARTRENLYWSRLQRAPGTGLVVWWFVWGFSWPRRFNDACNTYSKLEFCGWCYGMKSSAVIFWAEMILISVWELKIFHYNDRIKVHFIRISRSLL